MKIYQKKSRNKNKNKRDPGEQLKMKTAKK